ncbi:unnamed protein product [Darwinula stevensoni]|uniref:Fucosyltransferase n=1 Tax=Darwinula stevensoni TaxID=69355 RepID=A0A7R9FNE0_9CRUS|nr:unnamed protein product [Darwinula stevensoni]CAG0896295.1 unnamed protein product [Darwinula stevensoni]
MLLRIVRHGIQYLNTSGKPWWFFRQGYLRPLPGAVSAHSLFPSRQSCGDRILNQLMYCEEQEDESTTVLKTILLQDGWPGIQLGREQFLNQQCPVNACRLTTNQSEAADAVLFGGRLPRAETPRSNQLWIANLLESPRNLRRYGLSDVDWIASYRRDSEIVTPYEKWVYYDPDVKVKTQSRNYASGKTKKVAWFVSNCRTKNRRMQYARELAKHIEVDIYGGCGSLKCPRSDEKCFRMLSEDYKFYLSFENSNCIDYITEKFFVNGLGAAPKNSFLHVDNFNSTEELAAYLHTLDQNDSLYNEYFQWKGTGEFIDTRFFCRLCAMLHAKDKVPYSGKGPELETTTSTSSGREQESSSTPDSSAGSAPCSTPKTKSLTAARGQNWRPGGEVPAPFPGPVSAQSLFPSPDERGEDRIVNQLMYFQEDENATKLKTIFLHDIWPGIPLGQQHFLNQQCPVNKCRLTKNNADVADAVLFKGRVPRRTTFPRRGKLWIVNILESAFFSMNSGSGGVDWIASYRRDSEIVTPYEKWVYYDPDAKAKNQMRNYAKGKTKKVAWFVSHCRTRNGRLEYAKELAKYIEVDIYGECGTLKCSRWDEKCFRMLSEDYKFYLSFENSNCIDYITEKFFVNGLGNDILPIALGARLEDYERAAPKNSYLHVKNFTSPEELAAYLHKLDQDDSLYNEYFRWKGTGEFIDTRFFCRLCAMLHAKDKVPYRGKGSGMEAWWRGPGGTGEFIDTQFFCRLCAMLRAKDKVPYRGKGSELEAWRKGTCLICTNWTKMIPCTTNAFNEREQGSSSTPDSSAGSAPCSAPKTKSLTEARGQKWKPGGRALADGSIRPLPGAVSAQSLLPNPYESDDDRILKQLMYSEAQDVENTMKPKTILLYDVWPGIKMGQEQFLDQQCPVDACRLTMDNSEDADAVLLKDFVPRKIMVSRHSGQVWIANLLESPLNSGMSWSKEANWIASYRRDSEIVTPYEKWVYYDPTVKAKTQTRNFAEGKTKKVAWFVSNCVTENQRMQYAKELAKHIEVDIYGGCGSLKCPRSDEKCFQMLSTDYKFYLSFENSNCIDYITEKFFVNGLCNDILPIALGARLEDYERAAPKNSFLHVGNFTSPADLAAYLHKLDQDDSLYNEYFQWKGTGEFIDTRFFCRLCAMLHAKDKVPYRGKGNGSLRPSPERVSSRSLFPYTWERGDDRIVKQLMYSERQGDTNATKLKTILLYHREWNGVQLGRDHFLDQQCPVDTCNLTMERTEAADAVLFRDRVPRKVGFPRPSSQLWIAYVLEPPQKIRRISEVANANWTATYRSDSEIVTPYEKWVYHDPEVKTKSQTRNYAKGKTKKVAWFVSNCRARNNRLQYARELAKHIEVDIYGACGTLNCPRKEGKCFEMLSQDYKFYLAFENSNCKEYITEKFFLNGLGNDILPIVMGARPEDYERVAPKNSYLHVNNFSSPEELAAYLHKLDQDDSLYNEHFQWKGTGEFINTRFFCRLCAMLHAKDKVPYRGKGPELEAWWRGPDVCA